MKLKFVEQENEALKIEKDAVREKLNWYEKNKRQNRSREKSTDNTDFERLKKENRKLKKKVYFMDLQLKQYEIGMISNEDQMLKKSFKEKTPDIKLQKKKTMPERSSKS